MSAESHGEIWRVQPSVCVRNSRRCAIKMMLFSRLGLQQSVVQGLAKSDNHRHDQRCCRRFERVPLVIRIAIDDKSRLIVFSAGISTSFPTSTASCLVSERNMQVLWRIFACRRRAKGDRISHEARPISAHIQSRLFCIGGRRLVRL